MVGLWAYKHSVGTLNISVEHLGDHLVICISGGTSPHIGSVVLAEGRPSLTGKGTSATSSILNCIGHKDEFIARFVAERLAATLNTRICCICGIHKDNASEQDIEACQTLGSELVDFILERIGYSPQP